MAINWIIENETNAIPDSVSTEFTTYVRGFWLYGKGFASGEYGRVMRVDHGEQGTNSSGPIEVSFAPNFAFVDAAPGTYRLIKSKTANPASVGFEEAL